MVWGRRKTTGEKKRENGTRTANKYIYHNNNLRFKNKQQDTHNSNNNNVSLF